MFRSATTTLPKRMTAFRSMRRYATGASLLAAPPPRDTSGANVNLQQTFAKRKVVVVGVVGAFTGTCTDKHVP
jgi:peroxiredoxin